MMIIPLKTRTTRQALPTILVATALGLVIGGCGRSERAQRTSREVEKLREIASATDTLTPKSVSKRISFHETELLVIQDNKGRIIQLIVPPGAFRDSTILDIAADDVRPILPIRNVQIPRIVITAGPESLLKPLKISISTGKKGKFIPLTRMYRAAANDKLIPLPDQIVTDSSISATIYHLSDFLVGTVTQSEFNSVVGSASAANLPSELNVQSNAMEFYDRIGSTISRAEIGQMLGMDDYAQGLLDEAAEEVASQMKDLVEAERPADPCAGFVPSGLQLLALGQSLGTDEDINSRLDNYLQDILKNCPLNGFIEWKMILLLGAHRWEIEPDQPVPITRLEGTRVVGHGRQRFDSSTELEVSSGETDAHVTLSLGMDYIASLVGRIEGYSLILEPTIRYAGKLHLKLTARTGGDVGVIEATYDPDTQEASGRIEYGAFPLIDFKSFESNAPLRLSFDLGFAYSDGSTFVYRIPFEEQELKGVIIFTLRLSKNY